MGMERGGKEIIKEDAGARGKKKGKNFLRCPEGRRKKKTATGKRKNKKKEKKVLSSFLVAGEGKNQGWGERRKEGKDIPTTNPVGRGWLQKGRRGNLLPSIEKKKRGKGHGGWSPGREKKKKRESNVVLIFIVNQGRKR